ncbi:Inner membrane protein translocase component YidC, long form [Candidatus Rhodobacter oscarellae]|uniref:Membrane protein insertase YidC n=1 Tax=Candidatus Rhodobacter oscarellae TaxID=1675527 RepID=A0A0J9E5E2_9RHOB|nr:membrane protein insertase YidC [Candidatus Rhodobacter lobularis]KMW57967.1 Inner membrane protein translocase component YidC, long form [Candidatus Rhodobacter lobularis]
MDEQNRNLILAIVLSTAVLIGWTLMFPPPEAPVLEGPATAADTPVAADTPSAGGATTATTGGAADNVSATGADIGRVEIETPRLGGSISLQGGRIDDLELHGYKTSLDAGSPDVTLFAPVGAQEPYFVLYGWAPGGDLGFDDVPSANTVWTLSDGDMLTPETPITLTWQNTKGLKFSRTISVDADYLFTVTQSVENTGSAIARLAPDNKIVRVGQPLDQQGFFIIHEGAIRQTGEEREEWDWNDFPDLGGDPRWGASADAVQVQENGWVGFTDHYWMSMMIPAADQPFESVLRYSPPSDRYETVVRLNTLAVEPGETQAVTTRLFAGAKEWETIRDYQDNDGIHEFVDSIDWGWFFYLTKPIFFLLHWVNQIIGNMGWSIIALTLIIKAVLFPLAYRSYVSMAKMKELQPEMEKLREKAGDDRQKLQQEMMALYKKEKVNPAGGCLPILLQIPIFFSLYKVIFVTIELRHAPWFGWITDLSAPDPSSIFNLFGILPFAIPELGLFEFLSLGILPILLGISMWLQQKLNPAPADPTQQMIFAWMPWVFMFMLGVFASGLLVYWIANNTITFAQQYLIMRSQGYKPDVFGNIRSSFKRKDKPPEEPTKKAKK